MTDEPDEALRPAQPKPARRRSPARAGTPSYVPPGGVLTSYPAYACPDCGNRFYTNRPCCVRPVIPVTVTITRREEAPGG